MYVLNPLCHQTHTAGTVRIGVCAYVGMCIEIVCMYICIYLEMYTRNEGTCLLLGTMLSLQDHKVSSLSIRDIMLFPKHL